MLKNSSERTGRPFHTAPILGSHWLIPSGVTYGKFDVVRFTVIALWAMVGYELGSAKDVHAMP